jgi:putative transposase
MSRAERRALVEREAVAPPVSRQCRLLSVSRASVYRRPAPVSAEDCTIMALIDRQYLARPYYGSRRMAAWLVTQGHAVNRKRVQRLMRLAGLVAIYQRPNTSKPAPAHKIYPYLLGGLAIERVNQVWCADVTYIPMARGFLYLVVIMDWVSRAVLAWRLSNTLGAEFCVEALEEALFRHGRPRSSIPTVNGSSPVPGWSDSNTDRPLGRLAPQCVSVWSDPHSDRPTVSFLGPVGRPGTLAVRLCLADACDPRRA